MWFRNLQLYRLIEPFEYNPESLHRTLGGRVFKPCAGLDNHSLGWVPPAGREATELVHVADGRIMLCLRREDRILPATDPTSAEFGLTKSDRNHIVKQRTKAAEAYLKNLQQRLTWDWADICTPAIEQAKRGFYMRPHVYEFWTKDDGMGIVALSIAVLPVLGGGGTMLFRAEVPGPTKDKLAPRIAATSATVLPVSGFSASFLNSTSSMPSGPAK